MTDRNPFDGLEGFFPFEEYPRLHEIARSGKMTEILAEVKRIGDHPEFQKIVLDFLSAGFKQMAHELMRKAIDARPHLAKTFSLSCVEQNLLAELADDKEMTGNYRELDELAGDVLVLLAEAWKARKPIFVNFVKEVLDEDGNPIKAPIQ